VTDVAASRGRDPSGWQKGEIRIQRASAGRPFARILIGIAALAIVSPAVAAPLDRWQWLEDTFWYVPSDHLLALASSPTRRSPLPVSDQTVYHIVGYSGGYFWGPTAVTYEPPGGSGNSGPSCLQLVGSVTPEGKVHLTFTLVPTGTTTSSSNPPTVGIGMMTRKQAAWTMENQMSTVAVGNVLLTHWAYMFACRRYEACFTDLPGSGLSIPEFLAPCQAAADSR
jgi:hypothetical protein